MTQWRSPCPEKALITQQPQKQAFTRSTNQGLHSFIFLAANNRYPLLTVEPSRSKRRANEYLFRGSSVINCGAKTYQQAVEL